jgi:enamine deaminase RidA (YjgF/YER057c/UK114 family)
MRSMRAPTARNVREFFGRDAPSATVVAQAPDGRRRVALDATILAASDGDIAVTRRACDGVAYSVVTVPDMRQIHCGGIASDLLLDDPEAQATEAFARMGAVLQQEGMSFGHVVRQWGYIEGLLDVRADCPRGHQRYQAFNDVRALAYARSEFPCGYPAATGIGQAAGGVVLEFIALDAPSGVRVTPLSNPRQTDAHCYSGGALVGESLARLEKKSTPKFERAKLVARGSEQIVFVSGTAAIVGERSVAEGDVEAQTRTTIDNVAALVGDARLSRLRAYVKRASDFAAVRRICDAAFGPIPAMYVQADVCRDELLVELEGALGIAARTSPQLAISSRPKG